MQDLELRARQQAAAILSALPAPDPTDRTDAGLAMAAAEMLTGRLVYVSNFGWRYWSGTSWGEALEHVQVYVVDELTRRWSVAAYQRAASLNARLAQAHAAGDPAAAAALDSEAKKAETAAKAMRAYRSATKIQAVVTLLAARLCVGAEIFDAHPYLLTVANGVVDLRTGELGPHDPGLMMTKAAPTDYDPLAQHVDWDETLRALDPEVREFAQDRFGQAITGFMTPADEVVFCLGGGSNGKSTLFAGLQSALGPLLTYLSEKVITGANEHQTTLMDLLGARLAFLEELPDSCTVLPTGRIKALAGTPQVSARRMRQDQVTFKATHSLFVTLNNRPAVAEADDGTWRRLCVMPFPYSYRKAEDCITPNDRVRDDGLRERLASGSAAQAALAWLVAGAVAFYRRGKLLPHPQAVTDVSSDWRMASDQCKAFAAECLVFDSGCWIPAIDMTAAFARWQTERGAAVWGRRTFQARFNEHADFRGRVAFRENMRPGSLGMISRREVTRISARDKAADAWEGGLPELPFRLNAYTGVRFAAIDGADHVQVAIAEYGWPVDEPEEELELDEDDA